MKHNIAIYDMDKTVTRKATYAHFICHMVTHLAPWRFILSPLLIFAIILYGLKIWQRKELKQFIFAIMIGNKIAPEKIAPLLESYGEKVIANNIYWQIAERMREEKEQGYVHVLATASFELYVHPIARRLGFDAVIGTKLQRDSHGNILAKLAGENCYAMEKIPRIEQWMKSRNFDKNQSFIRGYSDHVSDAPLLDFADEAFATNPHGPLHQLAVEKGWAILDWRAS
ncbi:hypothetical protein LPB140_05310 [Sphingorhabdus lutea]|uniref:HAD-IB family hydrolase n=1 Tax=Sphingorhabdus lutea TaxID=1913578 RepID=A0A1L3JER0_9SPHN|nr:HAD-IB family hydrolase [Sphingorhabdus lutea]APG63604.1 hypothetical protein LPB140_05310 [Sphingorhabdus lutea]